MTRLTFAVAASRVPRAALDHFLERSLKAGIGPDDEVCVAATPRAGESEHELAECGEAGRVTVSVHGADTTPMRLWGIAMARARGAHVAVLDGRDPPAPGWVAAWERAPRDAIVYGPVDPGALGSQVDWAAYLSEYGQFASPLTTPRSSELPGNNLVFPRAWLPDRETLAHEGFWKTFHLERLRQTRTDLRFAIAAEMIVEQTRSYRLGEYLQRRALHGRCYSGRRLEEPHAPPRAVSIASTPLLPALRTWRVARRVPGRLQGRLARCLPALLLGEIAWSVGELMGYTLGPGDSCERLW